MCSQHIWGAGQGTAGGGGGSRLEQPAYEAEVPPPVSSGHPQNFIASHLKHYSAKKGSQLNMENHQVALKVASLACPQLNSYFSFP